MCFLSASWMTCFCRGWEKSSDLVPWVDRHARNNQTSNDSWWFEMNVFGQLPVFNDKVSFEVVKHVQLFIWIFGKRVMIHLWYHSHPALLQLWRAHFALVSLNVVIMIFDHRWCWLPWTDWFLRNGKINESHNWICKNLVITLLDTMLDNGVGGEWIYTR